MDFYRERQENGIDVGVKRVNGVAAVDAIRADIQTLLTQSTNFK